MAPLTCTAVPEARRLELPKDGSDLRLAIAGGPAWLEIEETGQRVSVADAPVDAIAIPQPLRLGWHWLPASAGTSVAIRRRETQSRTPAAIKATLHCSATPELQVQIAWLQRAGAIGASLDKPTDPEHFAHTLAAIHSLDRDAPSALQHAIALHFAAEAFGANSRSNEATEAFAIAEQAWSALGERERASAAHLGRIEGLRSTDAYQSVLDQTPDVSMLRGPQSYFSTRLENPRCLSLQALGRLDDAAICFDWLLKNYRALDEQADYIVAAQNYAGLQRDRGYLQEAEDIGLHSLEVASGPDAPMLRGRLRLMLADIALRRGQIARSFNYAQFALSDFDSAQYDVASWRASALMFTAILYSQLGANGEAYGALGEAVKIIAPLGSARSLGVAMNIFADIETSVHHDTSALWWRRAAEETYSRLNMAAAAQATRALRLDLQTKLGDLAGVERELAHMSASDPLHAAQLALLRAELAVHEERFDDARAALDQASHAPTSLRNRMRIDVLDARLRDRAGDAAGAQQALHAAAARTVALARRAGYAALRQVIARQSLDLRRAAFRLALRRSPSSSDPALVESIWQWLELAEDASATKSTTRSAADSFDRAVATELLTQPGRPNSSSDALARRELLALLAQPAAADSAPPISAMPRLATLQQRLDADSALIAYIDGDEVGGLLWVTRDAARLVAAAPPDQVRASASAFRQLVRSPSAPIAAIREAAQRLSAQLLAGLDTPQPPSHLYVVADEPLDGLAWSALPWPGSNEPLVESTTVSLVHLSREAAAANRRSARMPSELHVVVAAQSLTSETPLRPLAVASVEAMQIRKALAQDELRIDENTHASPHAVLDLLGESAAWVHVAAHGLSQPQRIGYAGIWLEPPASGATPAFLSWLDVLDNGARADLVVLDACQLGDSGSAVSGNLSFADAVARAGAQRVVAALWPVSDAASALWVPAFYRALVDDERHDAAQALRTAQLRLRATRAFTHPFFWAGMQSIERLPLAPAASSVKPN